MNKEYQAQIFVPSVARFPDDLRTRHEILQPARDQGFKTGLMVVLLRPEDLGIADELGLDDQVLKDRRQKQLDNLDVFGNLPEEERPGITVMHPWRPLLGEKRLNFLTNPAWSEDYVADAIDFAAEIPDGLTPEYGRYLSFHTNTMVTPDVWDEWMKDPDYLLEAFEDVQRRIGELSFYGKRKSVNIGVETIPIPAFGDWAKNEKSRIPDTPYYFADLVEAYPLLPQHIERHLIRKEGAHITHDFSHTFIGMRAVQEVKRLGTLAALNAYKIYEADLFFADDVGKFDEVILEGIKDGDMVHANNAKGIYRFPQFHGTKRELPYKDSASLSRGDIPRRQLRRLIKGSLQRQVHFVIEVNEPDGKMLEAPNTKEFLDFVLNSTR